MSVVIAALLGLAGLANIGVALTKKKDSHLYFSLGLIWSYLAVDELNKEHCQ